MILFYEFTIRDFLEGVVSHYQDHQQLQLQHCRRKLPEAVVGEVEGGEGVEQGHQDWKAVDEVCLQAEVGPTGHHTLQDGHFCWRDERIICCEGGREGGREGAKID